MNILFVDSDNDVLSRTAEIVYSSKYSQDNNTHQFRSVGIKKNCLQPITKKICNWADRIICMQNEQKNYIEQRIGEEFEEKIKMAWIQGDYKFMDRGLQVIVEKKCLDLIFQKTN